MILSGFTKIYTSTFPETKLFFHHILYLLFFWFLRNYVYNTIIILHTINTLFYLYNIYEDDALLKIVWEQRRKPDKKNKNCFNQPIKKLQKTKDSSPLFVLPGKKYHTNFAAFFISAKVKKSITERFISISQIIF